jgi:hypothetical protein
MRDLFRPLAAALSVACFVTAITIASTDGALAQARQAPAKQMAPPPAQVAPPQQPALRQMALTGKQIEGVLAAQKEIDAITAKLPDNAKPDPRITAQLDGVAKKNGFAGYDEYNDVIDNISLVFSGFDPASKKYVGPEAVIKAQIGQLEADRKMSPKDKKEALADLNQALKSPPLPVENKGNIDLVAKYYDRLAAAMDYQQQ